MSPFKSLVAIFTLLTAVSVNAQNIEAVELYSQDELIRLINTNQHLQRVKADRCQLVQDIEARAEVMQVPAYQFLWGDMLAWGVCVDKNAELGIFYMRQAANQGLAAALEQLGRYHNTGTFVQADKSRALILLREAAALGNVNAKLQLAELFIDGHGSPYDFEDLYFWLYTVVVEDRIIHRKIANYLSELEALMHPKAVEAAKRRAAK